MDDDNLALASPPSDSNDDDDADGTTLSQFLSITGHSIDANTARQYLEMSGNNLETAVSLFLEMTTMDNNDGNSNNRNNENTSSNDHADDREEDYGGGGEEGVMRVEEKEHDVPNSTIVAVGVNYDNKCNNSNRVRNDDDADDAESLNLSEPDYDYLLAADGDDREADANDHSGGDQQSYDADSGNDIPSSPDYDYLGISCDDDEDEELLPSSSLLYNHGTTENNDIEQQREVPMIASTFNNNDDVGESSKSMDKDMGRHDQEEGAVNAEEEGEDEHDLGEEYILGTLMVRVLQAKNLKTNPHNQGGGGGITNLLSNHRRFRHHKSTMSPASGGNLTPSSYHNNQNQQQRQIYAKLSYRDNPSQSTSSMASEQSNGDYHWSRGDQSYFDVTCPSFPLRMGHRMQQQQQHRASSSKVVRNSSALAAASPKKDTSRERLNGLQQQHPKSSRRRPPPPPTLQLSLYSKKSSGGSKINYNKQNKWLPYLGNNNNNGKENVHEKSNDLLLGKCSINVLRILSGKTPYFDEWCALHNDDNDNDPNNRNDKSRKRQPNNSDDVVGRVRIVIEYEPSDPPPRPGDMCVFANAYPLAEELYPVPLHSTRNAARTASATSSSSATYSQQPPSTTRRPKRYRVEEAVGDHIVLSYRTPVENWTCTFEAHRYLLLCVERHQACVEKYRERVLDLCDNVSQSPAMGTLARTVETLPDEGLVYVGAELVGGGVSLLGRWWEVGVEGLVEDVVDGINLDGRYTTLSEKEEEDVDGMNNDDSMEVPNQKSRQDKGNAIPGMPCCPITGLAMVEPVVAADGHTYERHAMARWLRTSNRSPLTGETLAHSELVPNYLLLSSLGNNDKVEAERVLDNENVNNV